MGDDGGYALLAFASVGILAAGKFELGKFGADGEFGVGNEENGSPGAGGTPPIRDAPSSLASGLSLHADWLPFGSTLRELKYEFARIKVSVRCTPRETDFANLALLKQQLKVWILTINHDDEPRLSHVVVRMQLITSVERSHSEPKFAIDCRLEIKTTRVWGNRLHVLPVESSIPRQEQPDFLRLQSSHFDLIESERNAKAWLIGEDRVGELLRFGLRRAQ